MYLFTKFNENAENARLTILQLVTLFIELVILLCWSNKPHQAALGQN